MGADSTVKQFYSGQSANILIDQFLSGSIGATGGSYFHSYHAAKDFAGHRNKLLRL